MPETTVIPELETLRTLSPEAYDGVLEALALAERSISSELLEPMQQRISAQLGKDDHGQYFDSGWSPLQEAVADFTDQFVFFVAGVTPELRQPLEDALSVDELHDFIKALYTLDMGYRLRLVHQGLFGQGGEGPLAPLPPREPSADHKLDPVLKGIWRTGTIMADAEINHPETIEFLRLRCSYYHDCHT